MTSNGFNRRASSSSTSSSFTSSSLSSRGRRRFHRLVHSPRFTHRTLPSSAVSFSFFALSVSVFLSTLVCYSSAATLEMDGGYYERHIGQTAQLKCLIRDCIPGANCYVQWLDPSYTIITQDSKESLAHYQDTRYSLKDPSPSSLDWTLQIQNLEIEDDGVFRCNLFVDGKLKATEGVTLVVLVEPNPLRPIISGPANSVKTGDRLSVQEGLISLECVSWGAKPATRLRWETVDEGGGVSRVVETETRKIVRSEVVNARDKTSDSYSTLSLGVVSVDAFDGAKFRCNANYGTSQDPKTTWSEIVLDIQHPPSSPVMRVDDSSGNNVGDRVQVTCSVQGGTPEPTLSWYFADSPSQLLDGVTTTIAGSAAAGADAAAPKRRETVSTLEVLLTREIFSRLLVCGVRQRLLPGGVVSANLSLPVNFAPARLHIIGAEANFKSGDRHVITCRTEPANPPWDVKWSIQPNPTFQTRGDPSHQRIKTVTGWISESNITIDINRDDQLQNTRIDCEAVGGIGTTPVYATKFLKTMVAPERVVMVTTPAQKIFKEGDSVEIGCAAIGESHPRASVSLFNSSSASSVGPLLPASSSLFPSLSTSSSSRGRLVLLLRRSSNGVEMCCRVQHPVYNSSFGKYTGPKDCRTFGVKFDATEMAPPHRSTPLASTPVVAPTQVVLECESPSSNPPASITWFCGGVPCDLDVYQIGKPVFIEGAYRGQHTRSTLSFRSAYSHDKMRFTCSATHFLGNTVTSPPLAFGVEYAPVFAKAPPPISGSVVTRVLEGDNKTFTEFAVSANPPVTEYRWMRKINGRYVDIVSTTSSVAVRTRAVGTSPANKMMFQVDGSTGGVLSIFHVHRSAAGDYLVSAANARGQHNLHFTLLVDFPPEFARLDVDDDYDVVYADDGANATLTCAAVAHPVTRDMLTWKRPPTAVAEGIVKKNDGSLGPTPSRGPFVLTYFIPRVERLDGGLYTCVGNNDLRNGDGKLLMTTTIVKLVVNYAPLFPPYMQRVFAAKRGANGSLTCVANGAPSVAFSWCRPDAGCPWGGLGAATAGGSTPPKYHETTRRLGAELWASTLTISGVVDEDFGTYVCSASNRLGCHGSVGRRKGRCDVEIRFKPQSPPERPTNLSLVAPGVSSSSSSSAIRDAGAAVDAATQDAAEASGYALTLSWVPGFDGGLPQTFLVRHNDRTTSAAAASLAPPGRDGRVVFELEGLEPDTEYRLSVSAKNRMGVSGTSNEIVVRTMGTAGMDPLQIAIVAACVGGFVLILINVVIICVCVRRNKKKNNVKGGSETTTDSATPPNGMELYESRAADGNGTPGFGNGSGTYNSYHNFSEHYGSIGSDKPDFDDYSKQFTNEELKYINETKLSPLHPNGIGYTNGHTNRSMNGFVNGHLPNGKGFLGSLPLRHTHAYVTDDPYATMRSNHATDRPDPRLDRVGTASVGGSASVAGSGSAGPSSPQNSMSTESGVAHPSISSTQRTDYLPVSGVTTGHSQDLDDPPQESPGGSHYDEMGQPPQRRNHDGLGSSHSVPGRPFDRPVSAYGIGRGVSSGLALTPTSAGGTAGGTKHLVGGLGTCVDADLDTGRAVSTYGRRSPRLASRPNGGPPSGTVLSPAGSTPTRSVPPLAPAHAPTSEALTRSALEDRRDDNHNRQPLHPLHSVVGSPLGGSGVGGANPLLGSSEYLKPLHDFPPHLHQIGGVNNKSAVPPPFAQGQRQSAFSPRESPSPPPPPPRRCSSPPSPLPPPPPRFGGLPPRGDDADDTDDANHAAIVHHRIDGADVAAGRRRTADATARRSALLFHPQERGHLV